MENSGHLFSEFQPVSKTDWLRQIENDLRGKSLADLQGHLGNLEIDPFPHPDDQSAGARAQPGQSNHQLHPTPLFYAAGWEICEDIEARDVLAADRHALRALEGGAQALRFVVNENLGDHRMESLLEGIDLAAVSIHFLEKNKNAQPLHLLTHFQHVAKARHGKSVGELTAGSVNWLHEGAVVVPDAVELVEMAQAKLPHFKVLTINVRQDFSQPDGTVQALADAIAAAERWISELTDHGISAAAVNACLQFSMPVGLNYFVEIAKLRALRLLWANVLAGWNVEPRPVSTSSANRSHSSIMPPIEVHLALASQVADPYQNMIRATTQAMSAVLGGASRLTVLPSDAFQGNSTEFSRRIARNVQHILQLESHLDWVADPAAGSWYIESLTEQLAGAAWQAFQVSA